MIPLSQPKSVGTVKVELRRFELIVGWQAAMQFKTLAIETLDNPSAANPDNSILIQIDAVHRPVEKAILRSVARVTCCDLCDQSQTAKQHQKCQ